jgi:DnaJ-class molecular chaperone
MPETTEITEQCPNCDGTGRRFKASASSPTTGDDIGKCLRCNGSGTVVAEGVTHEVPANVTKEPASSPSAKAEIADTITGTPTVVASE